MRSVLQSIDPASRKRLTASYLYNTRAGHKSSGSRAVAGHLLSTCTGNVVQIYTQPEPLNTCHRQTRLAELLSMPHVTICSCATEKHRFVLDPLQHLPNHDATTARSRIFLVHRGPRYRGWDSLLHLWGRLNDQSIIFSLSLFSTSVTTFYSFQLASSPWSFWVQLGLFFGSTDNITHPYVPSKLGTSLFSIGTIRLLCPTAPFPPYVSSYLAERNWTCAFV